MSGAMRIFMTAETMVFFAGGLLGPLYAVFVEDIGGDVLTVGASWSLFMLLSGIGLLISGRLVDRMRSEKPVIMAAHLLHALGFLGYLLVSSPVHLFAVQVLLGIATAISYPSRESWFTRFIDNDKIAFQWATWEATYSITVAAASIIGALVVSVLGFSALFVSMSALAFAGLIVSAFIPEGRR
ncbi:MAG: MFS transporter [Candidatus Aenigmarchaeota archaeon]|nr:MFS transporter [Candidatus Aenigmarchaeota archaeon]